MVLWVDASEYRTLRRKLSELPSREMARVKQSGSDGEL